MAQVASNVLTSSLVPPPAYRSRSPSRSRSPNRSPERSLQSVAHTVDPLLSNLSPESTLEALSAVDAVRTANGPAQDALAETIANVSPADRAFAVRAALAGQKLKQWYKEVRSWQWPNKQEAGLGKGFLPPANSDGYPSHAAADRHYLGSLPTELALQYESRIEEIKDGMDTLDVDELKEHVLDQHVASRSRPVSASSAVSNIDAPLSYSQLSDFSALITATILHSLPVLSRLTVLLERWSVRMRVLRLIPGLRSGLSNTQAAVQSALERINKGLLPDNDDQRFSRESFAAARDKLQANVSLVAAQMDTLLDALEGREDSLPESWIDEIESIEASFATWVSQAERNALQNEWLARLRLDDNTGFTQDNEPVPKVEDQEVPQTLSPSAAQSPTDMNQSADTKVDSPIDAAKQSEDVCECESAADENPSSSTDAGPKSVDWQQPSPVPSNKSNKSSSIPISVDPPDTDISENNDSSLPLNSDMDDSISSLSSVQHHLVQEEDGSCPYTGEERNHQAPPDEELPAQGHDYEIQSTPVRSGRKEDVAMEPQPADTTDGGASNTSSLATPVVSAKSPTKQRALDTISRKASDESIGRSPSLRSGQHGDRSITASTVGSDYRPVASSPDVTVAKILDFGMSPGQGNECHGDFSGSLHERSLKSHGPEGGRTDNGHMRLRRTTSLPSDQLIHDPTLSGHEEGRLGDSFNSDAELTCQQTNDDLPKSKLPSMVPSQSPSLKSHLNRPKPLVLRHSFSSTDISTGQSESRREGHGRTVGEASDVEDDQSSPSKDFNYSPSTSPDSPHSPVDPIKPMKRFTTSNHSAAPASNVSTPKGLQPKRLRPSPVIKSTRPPAKPATLSPSNPCEDHLDEKISALLTTLPGRIHLSSSSEAPAKATEPSSVRRTSRNERVKSVSPAPSRSSTPTQPITLTAVNRSRRSLGPPDESGKLYHLHRGGKSAPVRLFVRSVGEDGERVMVRVGGGWADLGEYLREYVVHHGRRKVAEEKFEIKGVPFKGGSSNSSNNYSSGRITPTSSNGRTTPGPRPGSAFDVRRPSSSLSVRKTRRYSGSTGMETPTFSGSTRQMPSDHPVEESETPPPRRLSVPSSASADDPHTPPSGTRSSSTPLGLAGPKPRSRQVSMSPESEAWVEGVMGEARKQTGTLRHQYSSGTLRSLPPVAEDEAKPGSKGRSVSDIGGGSLGRRGYLRALNK